MNAETNALPNPPLESQVRAPALIPAAQHAYWALRREFWESRWIYLAPLAVAALFLVGFLITLIHLPHEMRGLAALDPGKQRDTIIEPYDMAAALFMGTFILVAMFYSIEALQRERRDRSILFWKSLPVSDSTTVLAKASIPFVVLPLLSCAIAFVTEFIMLLLASAVLGGSGGLPVRTYWERVSLFQGSLLLLYHVMTVHVLWSAPVYGWLLFVSAWARRAAFLWAVLPPLAICALEKLLFNTAHFAAFVGHFFTGGTEGLYAPGTLPMNPATHLTPGRFLATLGLWMGLGVTAAFLALAVRLRRNRGPA